jgi:VIT1/CCC1 family predicted Fe2+/Mn2+ transporter
METSQPHVITLELAKKLNWLRAAVLGANDGIVSTAGLVMGVAGATTDNGAILIAGVAALVAGSISMAGGEYASVSAQRDSEIASRIKHEGSPRKFAKDEHVSPMSAAVASFISFALGSVLPIVAITGPWTEYREAATIVSVVISLAITVYVAAIIGGAKPLRPVLRNVAVSLVTMAAAYGVGMLLGVAVA